MNTRQSTKPIADVLRIGLTGGIASGKSAVAELFEDRGVPVIDTDMIARQVVEPGQPALAEITALFGPEVLQSDGSLDRTALRRIVFADDHQRQRLEAVLHPIIRETTMARSAKAGGPYQLIVVPLLVESPMRHTMDRVLVVDVPEAVQLERLIERDAESREQAQRMIAAQASRQQRLAIADDVVDNSGSLDATRRQVAELDRQYRRLAKSKPAHVAE